MSGTSEGYPPTPFDFDPADREVREVMRPGVVCVAEDTSLLQTRRAMRAHGVHAVLVLASGQRPVGWITARGLLAWIDGDETLASARDAISEDVVAVDPSSSLRDAVAAILAPGVTHLLVRRGENSAPEGVVSEVDLLGYGRE